MIHTAMRVIPKDKARSSKLLINKSDVLDLRIVLKGCEPKVHRELLIRADITFGELHAHIQAVMGWENAHLHEFKVGTTRVGMEPEDDLFADEEMLLEDDVHLFELLPQCKGTFTYTYDFGDDWLHEIKVKRILPEKDPILKIPCCTGGTGACPPEDCGGPWGYAEMLEALRTGSAQRKKEIRSWLGKAFDPGKFDLEEVNRALRS